MRTTEARFATGADYESEQSWRQRAPDCTISELPFRGLHDRYELTDEAAALATRQIVQDGYFQCRPVIPASHLQPLVRLIGRLHGQGVLPIFAAVYDELWQLLFRLRHAFGAILGPDYRLPPDFWIWHVAPGSRNRGWAVHRDAEFRGPSYLRADGRPRMCTVWIPLTDATTHNSCIYVLPRPHDPQFQGYLRGASAPELQALLQQTDLTCMRALPADAGSILGWVPYLLHWGSQSTEWARGPRVSIGLYYSAADQNLTSRPFDAAGRRHLDFEAPECRLTFEHRLRIVANILDTYRANGQMTNEPLFDAAAAAFCDRWRTPQ